MRRLGDGVEAALHCSLVLAALPKDKVLPGKTLAEFHGVSQTYLFKHLRALTEANIVDALPGPKGGYRLSREPNLITLLDIVEAIDGTEPAFVCREIRRRGPCKSEHSCAYKSDCFIKTRMLASENVWRDSLRNQTVEDLVQDGDKTIGDETKKRVSSFIKSVQR
ncbi:MAG: Rrf2 family transcriptional regulator [Hyphomicrobiales bacterium]